MYKKILYPIKFEEFSLDVLSCILNFKKAGTKEIILLHIIDVAKLPMDKYEGYSPEDVKRFSEIADVKWVCHYLPASSLNVTLSSIRVTRGLLTGFYQ